MKIPLLHRLVVPLAALAVFHGIPRADASTIFWESNFNDLLFDASEQPLDGGFTFEAGIFAGGFVPTSENLNDWAANWQVFATASESDGSWDPGVQSFSKTIDHNPDGTSSDAPVPTDIFTQGEVVYFWVYNTKNREAGTEWALVADGTNVGDNGDNWIIPDPADPIGTVSYVWLLDDANTAIYGNLDGTFGGGQGYTLQTSLVPVPEPGSVLLLGVAMLGGLVRRRRGRACSLNLAH
ncbi:PEP-CTERM sorting domain-containing protein [Prosthecobacter sp. SYSU 5D2]|uniref:PEP-CTERM sorting domain-containing protein n=1 Tax=Prosthecobacter sp. SYSU 5D2 TaxID=3134134 RepID=UPI0031FEED0C